MVVNFIRVYKIYHDIMLFSIQGKRLNRIREIGFELESELQRLIENNLESILEISFVKNEMKVRNFRIDTVGFDPDSRSFVIVEYKRDKNQSIIDQGMAYVSLLLENKAEFILAYNEKFQKPIRKEDIDWTSSRIVFIAKSFTEHQKQASGFKDLPIELYEIKHYENKTILCNSVTTKNTESIKTIRKKPNDRINKEIRTYTEEDHLARAAPEIKQIYVEIKQIMESLYDDMQVIPKKLAITFKAEHKFAWVVLRKNAIDVYLKAKVDRLDDSKRILQDVTNIGHWGGGDSRIRIATTSELPYVRGLIEQAYTEFK